MNLRFWEKPTATLETERLILRPWHRRDAAQCFKYAKDDRVGPAAGWPPHLSAWESRRVIAQNLRYGDIFAIVPKEIGLPVGSISLLADERAQHIEHKDERELGFWLGVPYWGRGYMPEAVRAVLDYAFGTLHVTKVWCGYYEGNDRSKAVQQKCGFRYEKTNEDVWLPLLGVKRTELINSMTRQQWEDTHAAEANQKQQSSEAAEDAAPSVTR